MDDFNSFFSECLSLLRLKFISAGYGKPAHTKIIGDLDCWTHFVEGITTFLKSLEGSIIVKSGNQDGLHCVVAKGRALWIVILFEVLMICNAEWMITFSIFEGLRQL